MMLTCEQAREKFGLMDVCCASCHDNEALDIVALDSGDAIVCCLVGKAYEARRLDNIKRVRDALAALVNALGNCAGSVIDDAVSEARAALEAKP